MDTRVFAKISFSRSHAGLLIILLLIAVSGLSFSEKHIKANHDSLVNKRFYIADSLSGLYQVTDTETSVKQLIRKAEWAERYNHRDKALTFYRQALELNPASSDIEESIERINKSVGQNRNNYFLPDTDFERSAWLVQVLVLITMYSSGSMIVLLVFILFHRNYMQRETLIRQDIKERYQMLLMDYLFDDEDQAGIPVKINEVAANSFKRILLVDEMKDLIINLSGDAADKLRGLYYKLNLDIDSKRKAYSRKWHIKVKGFRELAFMNAREANDEIIRCLQSNNSILRMEAQLALVRLNDDDRFSFLDHIQRPFTKWEQINVHEMIVSHNLEIPDFTRWLGSQNRTVVIFSLNMIKVFKQIESWEKVIDLLKNEDDEVRKTAIYVLGALRIRQAASSLKNHYKHEVYENMLAILVALGRIADESAIKFLVMVIDKEDDVQLQIEAARGLRDTGVNGQMALEKLMHSDYKNYQIIIKHVLDKRI
jgi:tetratricopeptide (TPR) repeat protein